VRPRDGGDKEGTARLCALGGATSRKGEWQKKQAKDLVNYFSLEIGWRRREEGREAGRTPIYRESRPREGLGGRIVRKGESAKRPYLLSEGGSEKRVKLHPRESSPSITEGDKLKGPLTKFQEGSIATCKKNELICGDRHQDSKSEDVGVSAFWS